MNPPIFVIPMHGARPNWNIDTVLKDLGRAYDIGVRTAFFDGPHEGSAHLTKVPSNQWDDIRYVIPHWLKQHAGFTLGVRLRGVTDQWPNDLYVRASRWPWRTDTVLEQVWAPWAAMGCRWLGIDHSSHSPVTERVAAMLERQGVQFMGEAHDDFTRPYPTMAIPRWFYGRYFRFGMDAPKVAQNIARYVWMTDHVLEHTNKNVWDTMGISRPELLSMFMRSGYGIMSSNLSELEAVLANRRGA